jgi:hypothetical protein
MRLSSSSFIDVAADVSPLIISGGEVGADSRRLVLGLLKVCFGLSPSFTFLGLAAKAFA